VAKAIDVRDVAADPDPLDPTVTPTTNA